MIWPYGHITVIGLHKTRGAGFQPTTCLDFYRISTYAAVATIFSLLDVCGVFSGYMVMAVTLRPEQQTTIALTVETYR